MADSDGEQSPLTEAMAVDTFSDVGLRDPSNLQSLAIAICQLDKDFPAHEAAGRIQEIIAEAFKSSMPVPQIRVDRNLDSASLFSSKEWTMKIRENTSYYFEFDDAIIYLMKDIGHEFLHAEQAYMAAR